MALARVAAKRVRAAVRILNRFIELIIVVLIVRRALAVDVCLCV